MIKELTFGLLVASWPSSALGRYVLVWLCIITYSEYGHFACGSITDGPFPKSNFVLKCVFLFLSLLPPFNVYDQILNFLKVLLQQFNF